MIIGILSDTHTREASQKLPKGLIAAFQKADIILHAGDIYVPSVLDELEQLAPVMAAAGDDDYGAILNDRRVKDRHILHIEDKVLWLLHDSAYYHSLKFRRTIRGTNLDIPEPPDIVVFGHDHYSVIEYRRGILFINPGSPNSMGNASVPRTFAILEIHSGKKEAKTLHL